MGHRQPQDSREWPGPAPMGLCVGWGQGGKRQEPKAGASALAGTGTMCGNGPRGQSSLWKQEQSPSSQARQEAQGNQPRARPSLLPQPFLPLPGGGLQLQPLAQNRAGDLSVGLLWADWKKGPPLPRQMQPQAQVC